MSIEVDSIVFSFLPGRTVLNGVTADAGKGRITAMVGPNAVGKTTLLRIIANLLDPDDGCVRLNGRPIKAMTARERAAGLAYVAQRPTVDAPFTVRDVIHLGAFHMRAAAPNELVESICAKCDLAGILDARFHELSVGQQQRVSLARALVQLRSGGPEKALLLDEPMSAMDPKHVLESGRTLRAAADAGTTVLIVLHDLNLAFALADDVWAMHDCVIIAAGPIREHLTAEILERMYETPFAESDALLDAHPVPRFDFSPVS